MLPVVVVFLASGHAAGGATGDGVSAAGAGFDGAVLAVMAPLLLVLVLLW